MQNFVLKERLVAKLAGNIFIRQTNVGAIALSYPPRVRVRATVKLSAAFFHDESSITIGGVRKCSSARMCYTVPMFEQQLG